MAQGNRGYHPHLVRSELIATNDSGDYGEQELTLYGLDGEVLQKVYRPQSYGLTGHAPVGAHGMLLSLGGERNSSFLLGGEDPDKRPQGLDEGDVKLYDQQGNVVWMGQKNGISLSAADGTAVVKTPNGTFTVHKEGYMTADPGSNNVYLGLGGQGGARVMTESGPSANVYAKI